MLKEIAKKSGLSTATVSRILNGKGSHSAKSVKKVERIMEQLGFSTNQSNQAPDCIGIVMLSYRDFMANDYTAFLLTSMMETLTAEGCVAQIIPVTEGRLSFQYIKSIVERYNLKGLIIQEFEQLYVISSLLGTLDIPVICIGNTDNKEIENIVCCDNHQAGYDAASYLWSLGHRKFGIFSMSGGDYCQQLRLSGFDSFLQDKGASIGEAWVREFLTEEDSLTARIYELVNMEVRPTAMLITNSAIARKFIHGLHTNTELRIPNDLSLISFEEEDELDLLELPVTAIAQPTKKMGEIAIKRLIAKIRNHKLTDIQMLNCNLVMRSTTANIN